MPKKLVSYLKHRNSDENEGLHDGSSKDAVVVAVVGLTVQVEAVAVPLLLKLDLS